MYAHSTEQEHFALLELSTSEVNKCKEKIFDAVKDLTDAPDMDELFHICWRFMDHYDPKRHKLEVFLVTATRSIGGVALPNR